MGSLQAKQAAPDDHGGASTGCCGQHLVDIIQTPERYHVRTLLARNGNDEGIGTSRLQQLIVADRLTLTCGVGLPDAVDRANRIGSNDLLSSSLQQPNRFMQGRLG